MPKTRAGVVGEYRFLFLRVCSLYCYVHLRVHRAQNREFGVNVRLCWRVPEVYLRVMPVLLLGQVKGELVVNR